MKVDKHVCSGFRAVLRAFKWAGVPQGSRGTSAPLLHVLGSSFSLSVIREYSHDHYSGHIPTLFSSGLQTSWEHILTLNLVMMSSPPPANQITALQQHWTQCYCTACQQIAAVPAVLMNACVYLIYKSFTLKAKEKILEMLFCIKK